MEDQEEGLFGPGGELEIFVSEGNGIGCVSKQGFKKGIFD